MNRKTGQLNRAVNLNQVDGTPYDLTNPLPVTPVVAGGGAGHVVLYDNNGNPIASTNEGGGFSENFHVTNPTIEQTTGSATNNKNIQAGFVDGSGNLRPPLVDSITRRVQTDLKTSLTTPAPTNATVGVASAQVLASNANRKGAVFVNTSINTIFFGIGQTAVVNSGITLGPLGVWEMDPDTFSTGTINAIASAASSNLALQEFTS